MTYGNGRFVAVGWEDSITSTDGINWTTGKKLWNPSFHGVAYRNGIFVGVGLNGIVTSSDGISWTSRMSSGSTGLYGVTYGNGKFVVVGTNGSIFTSLNGISWTERNFGSLSLNGITYGRDKFVAVGGHWSKDEGVIKTSQHGIVWTERTSGIPKNLRGITFGKGLFVAGSYGGKILTSSDGINWTQTGISLRLNGITYGMGLFVAVGESGCPNNILTSSNGIDWTGSNTDPCYPLNGVTYKKEPPLTPTVTLISPLNGETQISIGTSVSVTFTETMELTTVTTNTLDTSCSGTFQVSSDNFSSCIQMSSSPSFSNFFKTFTVTPSSILLHSTNYKIRVTPEVKGSSGNTLVSLYESSNGVTTKSWTKQLNSSGNYYQDYGRGVTVDSSDNIYVIGETSGEFDNNTKFGMSNDEDVFLMKFNSSGLKQWIKQFGTSEDNYGRGVTVDSSDNIYVTGMNSISLNLDGFLVKYSDNGTKQWTRKFGSSQYSTGSNIFYGTADDRVEGVTVDSSDNIYVMGSTEGGLDGNINSGGADIFLIKYSDNGTKQWTKQFGTSSYDFGSGVTVDSSDNIYITGSTNGGLDGNTNSGKTDIILVNYNSSGVKQWTKQLGTSSWDNGYGVTVDSSNFFYGLILKSSITFPSWR